MESLPKISVVLPLRNEAKYIARTIRGASADSVVAQFKQARAVIPMHFKTRVADFLPYTADDFVKGKANVERVSGREYAFDLNSPVAGLK